MSETDHQKKIEEQEELISSLNSEISNLKNEHREIESKLYLILHQYDKESVSSNTRPTEPRKGRLGWGQGIGNRMQLKKLKEN